MKAALVTGAGGWLGRHVVALFRREHVAVTALVLNADDAVEAHRVEADRVVVGDARDARVVRDAVRGNDVVVHLAALPSPAAGTAEEVFCLNTATTFTVLEQAGLAGVKRAVIASSQAISGLPFSPKPRRPPYLPIDEAIPLQIGDPYALSKQADEATAAMMWWRHGLSVCALRFPFLGGARFGVPEHAAQLARDPSLGVVDAWAYLDVRDAARACLLAARLPANGYDVMLVAAPNTLVREPTESLLDTFLPGVARRRKFAGNEVPLDLRRGRAILGFEAENIWVP